jgi:hypothetical protein
MLTRAPNRLLRSRRDRRFESTSLHRRVTRELDPRLRRPASQAAAATPRRAQISAEFAQEPEVLLPLFRYPLRTLRGAEAAPADLGRRAFPRRTAAGGSAWRRVAPGRRGRRLAIAAAGDARAPRRAEAPGRGRGGDFLALTIFYKAPLYDRHSFAGRIAPAVFRRAGRARRRLEQVLINARLAVKNPTPSEVRPAHVETLTKYSAGGADKSKRGCNQHRFLASLAAREEFRTIYRTGQGDAGCFDALALQPRSDGCWYGMRNERSSNSQSPRLQRCAHVYAEIRMAVSEWRCWQRLRSSCR